jgi:hypothetical protein
MGAEPINNSANRRRDGLDNGDRIHVDSRVRGRGSDVRSRIVRKHHRLTTRAETSMPCAGLERVDQAIGVSAA